MPNNKSCKLNTTLIPNNKSYKLNTAIMPNNKSYKLNTTIMPNNNEKRDYNIGVFLRRWYKKFKRPRSLLKSLKSSFQKA